ncbi:Ff.00g073450.m01.CDS01 [Fusarium sp. VM40]|nr:Ff.00g073450.m01.CDS01 [Fusarium sp. VM40]
MEASTGSRLLGEVEEMSLEEMLRSLRSSLTFDSNAFGAPTQAQHQPHVQRTKSTHISSLDDIAAAHFHTTKAPGISISGRHLPLLYTLISNLISPPHLYAVLVIDVEGRFDATRLTCLSTHMQHVYIQRPARGDLEQVRALAAEVEGILLYGDVARASASREWWGTIVVGGLGAGDIATGWKGWLRVERENVRGFTLGISAEEAVSQKEQRQDVVDSAGWAATSQWGGFVFQEVDRKPEDGVGQGDTNGE